MHCAACGELQAQCNDVSSLTSSANELNIIMYASATHIHCAITKMAIFEGARVAA